MSSLYIHIPFCRKKCRYCDFFSQRRQDLVEPYLDALCQEWDQRKQHPNTNITPPYTTLYLGGGTPSLLTPSQLQRLLTHILKDTTLFPQDPTQMEITLEANPQDLTPDYLTFLRRQTPINRLSIGLQSLCPEALLLLGRSHTAQEAFLSVQRALTAGFTNISTDIIYSIPNTTKQNLQTTLHKLLTLRPPHISAYSLSIEENTPLHTMVQKHAITPLSLEAEREQMITTIENLTAEGYEHYETSSFALLGYRSRHNSTYWQQKPYLGLGASAHSYNLTQRRHNIANLSLYIERVSQGTKYYEEETLSPSQKYNEYIMLSLRTSEGISKPYLSATFPPFFVHHFEKTTHKLLPTGLIHSSPTHIRLTLEGILLSNKVILEYFVG